jgi:D-alanyl-D-alanine carboxypeptidase/D-alanyl-D-alanine-endopeptidase (penicillin-binding protein 4)
VRLAILLGICLGHGSARVPATARMPALPATSPAIAARIERVSRAYLGVPYCRDPLGEGSGGEVDRDPLMDRRRVDCLTFVEQVLAEATAARPADVPARLQRIRYRDGAVGFRTRNHFTVTDWLPRNAWLLHDATEALAPGRTRAMVKVIDRSAFFRGHGCDPAGAGKERSETRYIPRESVAALVDRLPAATLAILVQRRPGIIAAHCGWLLRPAGKPLTLRHASSSRGRVVDEPFTAYLRRQPANIAGVKLCVVREL